MATHKFHAGDLFPSIELPTLDGTTINLGTPQNGADWRLVVVYRGKHCPMCTRYLNELEALKDKYRQIVLILPLYQPTAKRRQVLI